MVLRAAVLASFIHILNHYKYVYFEERFELRGGVLHESFSHLLLQMVDPLSAHD